MKNLAEQHHAIVLTKTIQLAQSRQEDMFQPALSAKHTPTHPTYSKTPIGVLFNLSLSLMALPWIFKVN